jgi:hypothetical protein
LELDNVALKGLLSDRVVFLPCSHYQVVFCVEVVDLVLITLQGGNVEECGLYALSSELQMKQAIGGKYFLIFSYLKDGFRHNTLNQL